MSGIQFGRAGIDIALREPSSWDESGNQVTASGTATASSLANALALRDQLLGLNANPDEKTIPVVTTSDTNRTGYYRDVQVQCSTTPTLFKGTYHFPWSVRMTRVPGSTGAASEMIYRGANRLGKPAGVTANPWVAVPANWTAPNVTVTSGYYLARAGERGTVEAYVDTGGSSLYTTTATAYAPAAHWYDGAATLTVDGAVVVGRQCNVSTNWQLDNGTIKVTPSTADFNVSVSIGSGYLTASQVTPFTKTALMGTPSTYTGPVILRNSPEEVSIRLWQGVGGGGALPYLWQLDLTLRRGARFVSCRLNWPLVSSQLGLKCTTAQAMAHIDANLGGNVASSFDANGNKLFFLSPETFSEDLANGSIYLTSNGTSFSGAFGIVRNGAPYSTSGETAVDLRNQYFSAISEICNIVGR